MMAEWFVIVVCPECKTTNTIKMVKATQRKWKCPECKKLHYVADSLYNRMKVSEEDNG